MECILCVQLLLVAECAKAEILDRLKPRSAAGQRIDAAIGLVELRRPIEVFLLAATSLPLSHSRVVPHVCCADC